MTARCLLQRRIVLCAEARRANRLSVSSYQHQVFMHAGLPVKRHIYDMPLILTSDIKTVRFKRNIKLSAAIKNDLLFVSLYVKILCKHNDVRSTYN